MSGRLSTLILETTRKYYQEAAGLVSLIPYKELLERHCSLMNKIVLPATLKQVQELTQSYKEKCLRHYVDRKLRQFVEKAAKPEVPPLSTG